MVPIFFFHLYGILFPFHTAISFICKTPWLCYRPCSQDIASQVREGLPGFSLKLTLFGPRAQHISMFSSCAVVVVTHDESQMGQKLGLWHRACGELCVSGRQGQIQLPSPFHQACLLVQLVL